MQKTKIAESLMAVTHTHTHGYLENNKKGNNKIKTRLNL
jgi:hypothetical protein